MDSKFPKKIIKGDSISFIDEFSDFLPSNDWYCNYVLKSSIETILIEVTGHITIENDKYIVNISSSQSESFVSGFYNLNVIFFNNVTDERKTFSLFKIEIEDDLLNSTGKDVRTWEEIALENIQNYLKDGNNLKYKSYEIKGRKLEQYSPKELQDLYTWLSLLVDRKNSKTSKKGGSKIYCRFTKK